MHVSKLPAQPVRPRVHAANAAVRPTRAEIALSAISHNLRVIQRTVGDSKVLAVVKADGYGHGIVPIAQRLQQEGVDGFGVALAEEGLELREAGIDRAILVLNGIYGNAHREVVERGLTPVVYGLHHARAFAEVSAERPIDVHLKIDTGMGRLGVPMSSLVDFLESMRDYPSIRIVGLMTHFATADEDAAFVGEQMARFERAEEIVRAHGHQPVVRHAANSAAMFRHPQTRLDWVRPGVSLYGYSGVAGLRTSLRPAMRWRTEVISVRMLESGEGVGYGQAFRAISPTRIATLPLGYGDGLLRSGSSKAFVLVRGTRCRVIGRISMDLTTIEVTHLPNVQIGDEAVLLGSQGDESIDAEELAAACGTIPYEVMTNVSRRVPRLYVEGYP